MLRRIMFFALILLTVGTSAAQIFAASGKKFAK
jgi:hypothetical protein